MAPTPQNSAHIADPYASLALPPTPWPAGLLSSRTDPCKSAANGGGPGYYASEVDLGNNETCTLEPGLYVISNTWTGKNDSQYVGPGVTLYVRNGGYLDFKNGAAALTPMTTGALAGFSVVYDRTNTNMLSLQGNGTTEISGKVYVPSSLLDFNGERVLRVQWRAGRGHGGQQGERQQVLPRRRRCCRRRGDLEAWKYQPRSVAGARPHPVARCRCCVGSQGPVVGGRLAGCLGGRRTRRSDELDASTPR